MVAFWFIVGAYLLGSVPFGLLLGRLRGVDVRTAGSGNIGATNVWRTCGPLCGTIAFVCDVLKGLAPVLAARCFAPDAYTLHVAVGLAALLGHSHSVFLRFAGGKGVSTSLGIVLVIAPIPAVSGFALWAVLLLLTGYVSVGSLGGSLLAALLTFLPGLPWQYAAAVWVGALIIWVRHRGNIQRLIAGTENRFTFGHKATSEPTKPPESSSDDTQANHE